MLHHISINSALPNPYPIICESFLSLAFILEKSMTCLKLQLLIHSVTFLQYSA